MMSGRQASYWVLVAFQWRLLLNFRKVFVKTLFRVDKKKSDCKNSLMKGPCFLWKKKAGWCHIQQPRWHYRFFCQSLPNLRLAFSSVTWYGLSIRPRCAFRVFLGDPYLFMKNPRRFGVRSMEREDCLSTTMATMVFDKPLKTAPSRISLLLVTSCIVVSRVKYETQKGIWAFFI